MKLQQSARKRKFVLKELQWLFYMVNLSDCVLLLARVSVQAFKVIFISLGSRGAQWYIAKRAQSLIPAPAPRSEEACLFLCCSCCSIPVSWFPSFTCGHSHAYMSLIRLFFRSNEEYYHRLWTVAACGHTHCELLEWLGSVEELCLKNVSQSRLIFITLVFYSVV